MQIIRLLTMKLRLIILIKKSGKEFTKLLPKLTISLESAERKGGKISKTDTEKGNYIQNEVNDLFKRGVSDLEYKFYKDSK